MPYTPSRRQFIAQSLAAAGALWLPFPAFAFPARDLLDAGFHLTARPWTPLGVRPEDVLAAVEALCRFAVRHQDEQGAFIDPFIHREHQYATPYLAFALGALIDAGRADDLLDNGIRAMDHATRAVAGGNAAIPDQHGEFFIAPLTQALALYERHVPAETLGLWRERLGAPIASIIESIQAKTNNWRTYAMKGEWVRYRAGLVDRDAAVAFIEDAWTRRTQRERIVPDALNQYQDWNGHPQSHAVEAVGRGNLLALVLAGYDGPSAGEMDAAVRRGTAVTLRLQAPDGQCPPNGRTDDHVFNDVLYQLIFTAMAADTRDARTAGAYQRAAALAFRSIARWRQTDGDLAGSYAITKNHFDPRDRVGYQPASQYSNYSGAVMYHLAEAAHAMKAVDEQPCPAEVGGYAFATDERFGSASINAGGMQVFANLRGDTVAKYDTFWTPLGIVRFGRAGWDGRLGPGDGARDALLDEAVTFGPTWKMGDRWIRLAAAAEHVEGTLYTESVHPLLVRCSLLFAPVTGVGGPSFFIDLIVTPDGVLATVRSPNDATYGLTLPLLEDDGRELAVTLADRRASVAWPAGIENGDEQHFLLVNPGDVQLEAEESVQGTYGWLRPVRATAAEGPVTVFVYPRSPDDPPADAVQAGFRLTDTGFMSPLGRVEGEVYVGRYAAGGFGDRLDLTGDGAPDIVFAERCGFVVQHTGGVMTAVEADRAVSAQVGDRQIQLTPFEPLRL
ncbi:MAG: hypothetical protein R2834_13000 [Rhodothermales bacterium]